MRRRVVLLAVWLLGVAGLWWRLPPAPRLVWRPPAGAWVVGLASDGLAVVAHGNRPFLSHQSPFGTPEEGVARGPVEAWDTASGRRVWAYAGPDDRLHVWCDSACTAVTVRPHGPSPIPVRLDPRSGAEMPADKLPLFDGQPASWSACDGTIAFVDRGGEDGVSPSTLTAYRATTGQRLYTLPPRFRCADAVSADGHMVAELEIFPDDQNRPAELVLHETATGREVCRWPSLDEPHLGPMAVSPDGSRVLVSGRRLFDTVAGRIIPFQGLTAECCDEALLTGDGRWVVVLSRFPLPREDEWEQRLDWYDAATGRPDRTRRQVLVRGEDWGVLAYAPDMRNFASGKVGKWLWLEVLRPPSRSAAYEWLNRQAPTLFPLSGGDGYSRVVNTDAGTVLADLPAGQIVRGVSDDGRHIMTEFDLSRADRQQGVALWSVPLRPSLRLFAALAGGWAVVLLVVDRRLGRSNRHFT